MNHFHTSDGQRVSKATIDRKVKEAKRIVFQNQLDEYGYNFCVKCGRNSHETILDPSHTISVDRCQKEGRAELAWDISNIKIRCRKCHQELDKLDLQF